MSATNRGSKRIEADCYPTPLTAFTPMLTVLPNDWPIWEPANGDGRLVKAMVDHGLRADGDDLKNGYDFLKDETARQIVLTNPPFSLAFDFCQHAVKHAIEVYLLLRLNFLASKTRREWFRANEPGALFVLSDRPSFAKSIRCKKCKWSDLVSVEEPTPEGCPECGGKVKVTSSDSCEYAWFYWGTRHTGVLHL